MKYLIILLISVLLFSCSSTKNLSYDTDYYIETEPDRVVYVDTYYTRIMLYHIGFYHTPYWYQWNLYPYHYYPYHYCYYPYYSYNYYYNYNTNNNYYGPRKQYTHNSNYTFKPKSRAGTALNIKTKPTVKRYSYTKHIKVKQTRSSKNVDVYKRPTKTRTYSEPIKYRQPIKQSRTKTNYNRSVRTNPTYNKPVQRSRTKTNYIPRPSSRSTKSVRSSSSSGGRR